MRVSAVCAVLVGLCAMAGAQTPTPSASGRKAVSPPAAPSAKKAAASPSSGAPLKLAWKVPFDSAAYRVAVADTTGDGKPHVVSLSSSGSGAPKLTISRWTGDRFEPEFTTSLGEGASAMTVGRFAGGTAEQIVTARFWLAWGGMGYVRHELSEPILPVGMLRRSDGSDVILARDGKDFAAYRIDPSATGQGALVRVASAELNAIVPTYGVMRAAASELQAALPPDYTGAGVLGIWASTPGTEALRFAALWPSQKNSGSPSVVLMRDIQPDSVNEVWRSPSLPGRAIDLCVGDPRGMGEVGLVALCLADNDRGRAICLLVVPKGAGKAPVKTKSGGHPSGHRTQNAFAWSRSASSVVL